MEQISAYIGRLFALLQAHPKYGLPVAMLLVGLYLVGFIRNWKWTLLPSGSSDRTALWIELFGEKAVRIAKAALAVLLLLCLIYLFFRR